MINFINNSKLNENKNSISITYPRTVNIIVGHYPYPDILINLINQIKNNINPNLENYTHIKGNMTDWNYFLDKPEFKNFISYLINKHQTTHPFVFQYFLQKMTIENCWGSEIKKGDSLNYHMHHTLHGILYLSEGCDLILPELNISITPKPGDYYIFPPEILHGFEPYKDDLNRYSLVFNINEKNSRFGFENKLRSI